MLYEITLTLRPLLYKKDAYDQFKESKDILLNIFKDLKLPYKISLVAELTQEDNVHYHGIVELNSFAQRAKLIDRFRRHFNVFGKKTITQLVNYPKWVEYINKSIDVTKQLIPDPIVFDDHVVLCDEKFRYHEPCEH